MNLLPNGTCQINGKGTGRYKAEQGEAHFDGQLKNKNNETNRVENGNLISEWKK